MMKYPTLLVLVGCYLSVAVSANIFGKSLISYAVWASEKKVAIDIMENLNK